MKMRMEKAALVLAGVLFASTAAWSQCKEIKWPENKAKAEECVAIWGDAIKQGHFRTATAPLQWMMTNAPQWNTKLWVDAAAAYDGLASKETDPAKKKVFVDSLLMIYDLRVTNCGDEINVLNRKAINSVKFNLNNKTEQPSLLALFDKVFEMSGNNVLDNNLEVYMSVITVNVGNHKNLTEDQILSRYDKLIGVIDAKIKVAQGANKAADVEKYKKIKSNVDDKLIKLVKVDCPFVKKNLEPKFKANPADIGLAKRIFQFMTTGGCIEDPLWLEAAEAIHKESPDYGLAKNMARVYAKNGQMEKAEELINEAVSLATSNQDKAETFILQGDLLAQRGSKGAAREAYRKAIVADNTNKEGYEKIGDLYINSFKDCAKGGSMAEDRLIYIAAFEMYAKAGNQQKMAAARGQFPSVTELFELNWKEGESKSISCWVGETVTLRTRGKE